MTQGEKHFNAGGESDLNYYKALILCGLYEHAIMNLEEKGLYQIENTHVAITLYEYDLIEKLRVRDPEDLSLKRTYDMYHGIYSLSRTLGKKFYKEALIYMRILDPE